MAAQTYAQGWPLDEAAWQFASPSLRRRARNPSIEPGPLSKPLNPDSPLDHALAQIGPILDRMNANAQALGDLRRSLLEKLRDGRLGAMGYPTHRDQAYDPVRVEPFLFQDKYIKWGRSRCEGEGRTYELVRVFDPAADPVGNPDAGLTAPIQKRPVGRPNVRSVITEIAIQILDGPKPPFWKHGTDLYPLIREVGMKRNLDQFDENNPKSEVMRLGLNDAFALRPALRRSKKL